MNIAVGFVCLVTMAVVEGLPNPEEVTMAVVEGLPNPEDVAWQIAAVERLLDPEVVAWQIAAVERLLDPEVVAVSSGGVDSENGEENSIGTNCTPKQWAAATAACAIKDVFDPWQIPGCIAKTCIHFADQVCSTAQGTPYHKQCKIIQQTIGPGFDMNACITHLCAAPKDKCVDDTAKLEDISKKCLKDKLLQCALIKPGECLFNIGACIYQLCHVQDHEKVLVATDNSNRIDEKQGCDHLNLNVANVEVAKSADDRYQAQCVGIVDGNNHANITEKIDGLVRCQHAHCEADAPTDTQVGASLDVTNGAHCDCHYVPFKFGCTIKTALNIPGFACRCVVVWLHCDGEVVNCKDPTNYFCQHPDKSNLSCRQGGGNCKGYHLG